MEKIRIKATGKVYELTNSDYDAAEQVIEKYRETGNNIVFGQDNNWVWTYNFKEEFDEAVEDMDERYGDLAEYAQELIDKYDESALLTGLDGCFYSTETDELFEDALDEEALGYYAYADDNLFYYVIPEIKFYLPEQVEVFYE